MREEKKKRDEGEAVVPQQMGALQLGAGAGEPEGSPVIKRGSAGRPIPVTANYIQLKVEEGRGVFEYEVQFRPQLDSVNERYRW